MEEEKQKKEENKKYDMLKWSVLGLAGFIIILLILSIGIWIGGERAKFSYRWADNYHKNFGGPREGFFGEFRKFPQDEFMSGHGEFGTIVKIEGSEIVIMGRDNMEKVVLVKNDTVIKNQKEDVKKDALKANDFIVIIGSPNESGQIEAKIIRVLPDLPGASSVVPFPLPGNHRFPSKNI